MNVNLKEMLQESRSQYLKDPEKFVEKEARKFIEECVIPTFIKLHEYDPSREEISISCTRFSNKNRTINLSFYYDDENHDRGEEEYITKQRAKKVMKKVITIINEYGIRQTEVPWTISNDEYLFTVKLD